MEDIYDQQKKSLHQNHAKAQGNDAANAAKSNENLYKLVPVLYQTLVHLEVMPHREFATPDALREALAGMDTILIDVTERTYRRPQDNQEQREHYSGKKKTHA